MIHPPITILLVYSISGALIGAIAVWIYLTIREKAIQRENASLMSDINIITATKETEQRASQERYESLRKEYSDLRDREQELSSEILRMTSDLSTQVANNRSLLEKLENQKGEISNIYKQFNIEFENIASKIMEDKSERFVKQNRESIEVILKPLGDNISEFKRQVAETYDKESKERFSLGKEIDRLYGLNKQLSSDAENLTKALKGSSKIQGNWGEMILEQILEKSGLTKDREYFVQEFLRDEEGNYLRTESGERMQPDAIVSYPDNRKVVIDSKVSLTAYMKFSQSDEISEQRQAIQEHLNSIRKHIDELSRKQYDNVAESLDFTMMFIPNEPAYFVAIKEDPNIWYYAYEKQILLTSPTNLITALKLIVDLWKREYQNRNAIEIAEKGGALYDKLAGLVETLTLLGSQIGKTQESYDTAMKQLSTGKGNLLNRAEALKELGAKTKKSIKTISE